MRIRKLLLVSLLPFFVGCQTTKLQRNVSHTFTSGIYSNQFTGLLVVNPATQDTLIKYNATKYFIPASNTKIATLYTALTLLPDSIPAFKYRVAGKMLHIRGTGDPTFLHPFFQDSTALKMVRKFDSITLYINNLSDYRYGPGWSWDDFSRHYSPERSSFPMYGNVVSISNHDSLQCVPKVLCNDVHYTNSKRLKDFNTNHFYYPKSKKNTLKIPMLMDSVLIAKLWNDLRPGKVIVTKKYPSFMDKVAYSVPKDSVLKRMMYVSDNFLAEQLLLLASSKFSRTLSSYRMRQYMLQHALADLPQAPRWVDGSGLSRYNLFSPADFVHILSKMYVEIPQKRLLSLFPVGGESGTLKKYFKGDPDPYIYAKSGTLGNNYSLSGFLRTKSGVLLIFSFMNNHFTKPNTEVKKEMQTVLESIRDNY